jgi:hypothetical protein
VLKESNDRIDRAAEDAHTTERLTSQDLLALQCAARGYSSHQIETLLQYVAVRAEAQHLLERVAIRLGVATVADAVAVAKRRRLII